ncbi:MAG: hypothetical protein K9M02_20305 [Thiohalocapsa sp.]|nr:hypothetical protein [Thiohalocapsa sp.]
MREISLLRGQRLEGDHVVRDMGRWIARGAADAASRLGIGGASETPPIPRRRTKAAPTSAGLTRHDPTHARPGDPAATLTAQSPERISAYPVELRR